MSALVASLLSIIEIAFLEAIFLFTSSFLSLPSRFLSFSMSIITFLWVWLLSGTVKAFGLSSGLAAAALEEVREEEGGGFVVSRRLKEGGNGWVGVEDRESESEAMVVSFVALHYDHS